MSQRYFIRRVILITLVGIYFSVLPFATNATTGDPNAYCCLCQQGGSYRAVGTPGMNTTTLQLTCDDLTKLDKTLSSCQLFTGGTCSSEAATKKIAELNKGVNKIPVTPPKNAIVIPGFTAFTTDLKLDKTNSFYQIPWIAEYISAIYKFGVGVAVVLAIAMVVFGGFVWLTAGGNAQQVTTAKGYILGALGGVVIALGSYSILYLVNPNLSRLSSIMVPYVQNIALEIGPRLSQYLEVSPGKTGQKNQFNAAPCPTKEEAQNGFDAFLTAYYAPTYGEKGPYKSFECNVAMQCSCPGPGGNKSHKDPSKTCGFPAKVLGSKFTDYPCFPFPASQPFCKKASYGTPVQFKTAAGDITTKSNCWSNGDQFTIEGIGGNLSGPWTINDQGSDIQGRHFDLFVGSNLSVATSVGGVYKVKFTKCQKCGF